jgi:DNA-binding FadR family transcriptional regulator
MSQARLFHAVADQIVRLIDQGTFPPGAKLPGERELAERFGVSRVTVREAEVALQATGRIVIKPGSGVYVADGAAAADGALPAVSAFELTEARSLFESEAAALAAPIISAEALQRLDVLVAAMASGGPEADEADREFHLTIATATGNGAILHTLTTLWRMRNELPQVRSTHETVCDRDSSSRVAEHSAVLDALKARDPAAARQAMRAHFNRLIEAMLDAAEEKAMRELRQQASESRERFLMSARL